MYVLQYFLGMVIIMDIKILKYFLAVANEGTITKASKKLHIAQPPLSRQIHQLEDELGVNLFIRGKRHIQLTSEGLFLKQRAEEIISLVQKTENELNKMKTSTHGTISIGVTETCGSSILSKLIKEFSSKYTYIKYNVWCGNGDEINEKLDRGLIDLGIVREPFNTSNYESFYLKSESWIVLLSKDNPLANNTSDTLNISEIAKEPLIIPSRLPLQKEMSTWFNEISNPKNVFCYYNTLSCIIPLIEKNVGIAICPESIKYTYNQKTLTYKKIIPEHKSKLLVIRKKNQVMPAATTCFWNFIQNYSKSSKL